jgi:hypothetical protein
MEEEMGEFHAEGLATHSDPDRPLCLLGVALLADAAGTLATLLPQRRHARQETDPASQGHPAGDCSGRDGTGFIGAIVKPVYLVPALTVVLALGFWAETQLPRRRVTVS